MEEQEFKLWLERAREGDSQALGKLLEGIEGILRDASRKRVGEKLRSKLRTSDVLQTTYVEIVRSIRDFRGDDIKSFASWVRRALENNVRDKARYYDRDRRREETASDALLEDGEAEHGNAMSETTPSRKIAEIEHLHIVGRALDDLEEDYRAILHMRMIEGLDHAVIAERMGRSLGAVRMLYSRARAALALRFNQRIRDV